MSALSRRCCSAVHPRTGDWPRRCEGGASGLRASERADVRPLRSRSLARLAGCAAATALDRSIARRRHGHEPVPRARHDAHRGRRARGAAVAEDVHGAPHTEHVCPARNVQHVIALESHCQDPGVVANCEDAGRKAEHE